MKKSKCFALLYLHGSPFVPEKMVRSMLDKNYKICGRDCNIGYGIDYQRPRVQVDPLWRSLLLLSVRPSKFGSIRLTFYSDRMTLLVVMSALLCGIDQFSKAALT